MPEITVVMLTSRRAATCSFCGRSEFWRTTGPPLDLEANLILGTVYQRLGDLTASDHSLQSVLDKPPATSEQRAEALELKARNAKTRGRTLWEGKDEKGRRVSALRSGMFFESQELYTEAFEQDLNHFYSGLNALSLADLLLGIMELESDAWGAIYDSEDEAAKRKDLLKLNRDRLATVVDVSLQSAEHRATEEDIWRSISQADYKFLAAKRDATVTKKLPARPCS